MGRPKKQIPIEGSIVVIEEPPPEVPEVPVVVSLPKTKKERTEKQKEASAKMILALKNKREMMMKQRDEEEEEKVNVLILQPKQAEPKQQPVPIEAPQTVVQPPKEKKIRVVKPKPDLVTRTDLDNMFKRFEDVFKSSSSSQKQQPQIIERFVIEKPTVNEQIPIKLKGKDFLNNFLFS